MFRSMGIERRSIVSATKIFLSLPVNIFATQEANFVCVTTFPSFPMACSWHMRLWDDVIKDGGCDDVNTVVDIGSNGYMMLMMVVMVT